MQIAIGKSKSIISSLIALAFFSLVVGTLFGLIGTVFYNFRTSISFLGLSFQQVRPLHTVLVVCWIFLAGAACVYHYLLTSAKELSNSFFRRAKFGIVLWGLAGIGIFVSFFLNHFSGREYVAFPPVVSLFVLGGWICLAVNFFSKVGFRWDRYPVYVWMWGVSLCLFIWTFVEAHLYLLPSIGERPLLDISIQWKSYGTLVGSFNLLVYGSLLYVATQISGCQKYAHSKLAFSLFFVSILSSFTNFGHHTYHLPQSHFVKWVAFCTSMLEILIFAKICVDVISAKKTLEQGKSHKVTSLFFVCATIWICIQLLFAIVISVPPINAIMHGTHAVAAHAMGSMIGIDCMVLWGVCFYLLGWLCPERTGVFSKRGTVVWIIVLNISFFVLWSLLVAKGVHFGWRRFTGMSLPYLSLVETYFPLLFLVSGIVIFGAMWMVIHTWPILLWRHLVKGKFFRLVLLPFILTTRRSHT